MSDANVDYATDGGGSVGEVINLQMHISLMNKFAVINIIK